MGCPPSLIEVVPITFPTSTVRIYWPSGVIDTGEETTLLL
ncbi:hypothetical protein NM2002030_2161 [Neisseria meningitidis 2002030]|nr:hypothetical protein NM2002030_2161 [Neisseria meningitidis 2002030]